MMCRIFLQTANVHMLVADNCGSALAGSQCGPTQMIWNLQCGSSPQGCSGQPASECINDPTCCSAWVNIGCGTTPMGQTPPPNNCNYGYEIQGHQCGSNNAVQCIPNSSCGGRCLGILSPGALYCATKSTTAPTDLSQNWGITYCGATSPNCPSCPASPQCQVYCAPGYVLNATATSCLFTVAPIVDSTGRLGAFCACPGPSAFGEPPTTIPCSPPLPSYCKIDPNDQSFKIPSGSGAIITAVSVVANPPYQSTTAPIAIPQGPGEDGCQNPNSSGVDEGEPGTSCQTTITD